MWNMMNKYIHKLLRSVTTHFPYIAKLRSVNVNNNNYCPCNKDTNNITSGINGNICNASYPLCTSCASSIRLESYSPTLMPNQQSHSESTMKCNSQYINKHSNDFYNDNNYSKGFFQTYTDTSKDNNLPLRNNNFPGNNNEGIKRTSGYYNNQICSTCRVNYNDIIAEAAQTWIRITLNLSIVCAILYALWGAISAVRSDIEIRLQTHKRKIKLEVSDCLKHYKDNNCYSMNRLPYLEEPCSRWEKCMSMDSELTGEVSQLSAKIFGEILNTFFCQLEWRTVIVIILLFICILVGSNWALSTRFYSHQNFPMHIDRGYLMHDISPQLPTLCDDRLPIRYPSNFVINSSHNAEIPDHLDEYKSNGTIKGEQEPNKESIYGASFFIPHHYIRCRKSRNIFHRKKTINKTF